MTTVTDKKTTTTGRRSRRGPRGPRWLRTTNPIYGLPPGQFYALLIYRLLIASMVSAVFIVGMITDK